MKSLGLLYAIIFLLGCERAIDPESITKIEYGYTIGFTGATYNLTIDSQKEVFVYANRPDKCERAVTAAEWSKLVEGFDWKAFKKVKSNNEPVCCDIGGAGVKVTIGSQSHEVNWSYYPAKGSKGVQEDFIKKLSERLANLVKTCP